MKKRYVSPSAEEVSLYMEQGICMTSGNGNHFDIGMSDDAMNGADALSNKKEDMWSSEDYWN